MTKWFHGYTDTYIHVVTEYPHIHISTHFRAYFKIHVAGPVHVLISAVKTSLLVSNCTVDVDLKLDKKKCTCAFTGFHFLQVSFVQRIWRCSPESVSWQPATDQEAWEDPGHSVDVTKIYSFWRNEELSFWTINMVEGKMWPYLRKLISIKELIKTCCKVLFNSYCASIVMCCKH